MMHTIIGEKYLYSLFFSHQIPSEIRTYRFKLALNTKSDSLPGLKEKHFFFDLGAAVLLGQIVYCGGKTSSMQLMINP